MTLSKWHMI